MVGAFPMIRGVQPREVAPAGAYVPTARDSPRPTGSRGRRDELGQAMFPDVLRRDRRRAGAYPAAEEPGATQVGSHPLGGIRLAPAAPSVRSGSPVGASPIVDRILVGGCTEQPEARIRIATGALAGAEIRLSWVGGQVAVEAQLLTSTAGSRQTLAVAIEEVVRRLRARSLTSHRPSSVAAKAAVVDDSGGQPGGRLGR